MNKTSWFLKFNFFLNQKQNKAARKILLQNLSQELRDPLLYICAYNFFRTTKEWKLLRDIFYKGLFIFPDSLFIKEVLLYISIHFFSAGKRSAYIISEFIIPLLSSNINNKDYGKITFLLAQYFYKRKILDSALFYSQMSEILNKDNYLEYSTVIQQCLILKYYKDFNGIKITLERNYELWKNKPTASLLLNYILPSKYFYPKMYNDYLHLNIKLHYLLNYKSTSNKIHYLLESPSKKKQIIKYGITAILIILIIILLLNQFKAM